MKIKKIGNIVLTYPLWWVDYNNVPTIQAETEETIKGGVIVWEQDRDISAYNITLTSETDGWQTIAIKDAIKALVSASLGATSTITLTDDTIIAVRFRHEIDGGAVSVERITET